MTPKPSFSAAWNESKFIRGIRTGTRHPRWQLRPELENEISRPLEECPTASFRSDIPAQSRQAAESQCGRVLRRRYPLPEEPRCNYSLRKDSLLAWEDSEGPRGRLEFPFDRANRSGCKGVKDPPSPSRAPAGVRQIGTLLDRSLRHRMVIRNVKPRRLAVHEKEFLFRRVIIPAHLSRAPEIHDAGLDPGLLLPFAIAFQENSLESAWLAVMLFQEMR